MLQAEIGSCTQHAEERLNNIRTVRIFAQEEREVERQNALLRKALQIMYQEAKMRAAFFGMVRYIFWHGTLHFLAWYIFGMVR